MQNENITEAEAWLLASAIDGHRLLSTLGPETVEIAFNREGHGLTLDELAAHLERFVRRGWFFLYQTDTMASAQETPLHPETAEEIKALLVGPKSVWYGLTRTGGELWEALFHPDWNRYAVGGLDLETGQMEAASVNRALLEAYLADPIIQSAMDTKTIQWQHIEDWQEPYWRPLGQAWRVVFCVAPANDLPVIQPAVGWYVWPT